MNKQINIKIALGWRLPLSSRIISVYNGLLWHIASLINTSYCQLGNMDFAPLFLCWLDVVSDEHLPSLYSNIAIILVQARKLKRIKLNQQRLSLLTVIRVRINVKDRFLSKDPTAALYNPKWAVPPLTVTWQQDAHSSREEFTLVSPSVPHIQCLVLQRFLSHWPLQRGSQMLEGIAQLRCW